jgi:hypothetical protein
MKYFERPHPGKKDTVLVVSSSDQEDDLVTAGVFK